METPIVSIILPTHGNPIFLNRAIQSVLSQTYQNWELIIVDDGLDILNKDFVNNIKKQDHRIFCVEHLENKGIQKSLNDGILNSRGKYLARIDDDDEWVARDKLERQVGFFENNPEYVLVGTNAEIVNNKGVSFGVYNLPQSDDDIRKRILSKNCFIHSSVMMKKSAVEILGGYSEDYFARHIEDFDLWLKMGENGKFKNLDFIGVKLMVHENSLTSRNRLIQAKRIKNLIKKYKNSYPRYNLSTIILSIRVVGFFLLKILPIQSRLLYNIQKFYKEM